MSESESDSKKDNIFFNAYVKHKKEIDTDLFTLAEEDSNNNDEVTYEQFLKTYKDVYGE